MALTIQALQVRLLMTSLRWAMTMERLDELGRGTALGMVTGNTIQDGRVLPLPSSVRHLRLPLPIVLW